jgi:hypothetical protein
VDIAQFIGHHLAGSVAANLSHGESLTLAPVSEALA